MPAAEPVDSSPAQAAPLQPQKPTNVVQPQQPIKPIKSANIDLLSDIDFSTSAPTVSTPPLQPLTPTPKRDDDAKSQVSLSSVQPFDLSPVKPNTVQPVDRKPSMDNLSIYSDVSSVDQNFDWESASMKNEDLASIIANTPTIVADPGNAVGSEIISKYKDAFDDPKVLKWFHKEVERLERFIETSTVKTLNGTTPLDGKWKELQDLLVKDESKRTGNIAKLFPEKNRSIDSIPYDHARISLGTSTDDYINAGFIKVRFFTKTRVT